MFFLKLLKLNVLNFSFVISSSGFAHCCVLQQRDVDPLLSGDHAVAHSEGKERFRVVPHCSIQ